jgi:hypothetical protein
MPTCIETDSPPEEGKRKESSSFLKKRTKKLLSYLSLSALRQAPPYSASSALRGSKVFCFFFSKRKYFLASPLRQSLRKSVYELLRPV